MRGAFIMWNELYLEKANGEKLFVDHFMTDLSAPNILYIQTPQILSVTDLKECYEPLSTYGFNIFALDLSGVGKSGGKIKNFTIKTLNDDISLCISHIKANFNGKIHFFGGTGTGGILAQCYVSQSKEISSFAQYGVANYNDLSLFPHSKIFKLLYPFLKLVSRLKPDKKIKFSTPSYNGKNADKENEFYKELLHKFPGGFDMNQRLLVNVLGLFIDKNSPMRESVSCPTLFFAPQHDRYFSRDYLKKYGQSLTCEKKMYVIDDAHSSYVWHAQEICQQVSEWFWKFS